MSARIAKGGGRGGSRGRSRSGGNVRRVNTRRAKSPGLLESFGFAPGTGKRIAGWIGAGMVVALVVTAILAFRLPQLAGTEIAEAVGDTGFTMRRVEIKGAHRVSRLDVYNIAFDQPSMAMPLIDLAATRERLLRFGWIKEARVQRRLPDTLVIDIVERTPAAIWQNNGRMSLVDGEGVVLEPVQIDAMPELTRVIGAGANRHLAALTALLDATPHLRPQVTDATWVGDRRWDLHFQSGEVLSLPEGDEPARRALTIFARMDQQSTLLGRGYARIDMRIPNRAIVRLTRQPGATVPSLAPSAPEPGQPAPDLARTI
jgi:cell division protein FtsQ